MYICTRTQSHDHKLNKAAFEAKIFSKLSIRTVQRSHWQFCGDNFTAKHTIRESYIPMFKKNKTYTVTWEPIRLR